MFVRGMMKNLLDSHLLLKCPALDYFVPGVPETLHGKGVRTTLGVKDL